MYAIINGERVDASTKELLAYLWQIPLQHKYASEDALRENILALSDLIIEALENEKNLIKTKRADNKFDVKALSLEKTFYSKTQSRMATMKEYARKRKGIPQLHSLICETIMSLEGKALLPGFGFCSKIFKDPLRGNPEKDSILKEQ